MDFIVKKDLLLVQLFFLSFLWLINSCSDDKTQEFTSKILHISLSDEYPSFEKFCLQKGLKHQVIEDLKGGGYARATKVILKNISEDTLSIATFNNVIYLHYFRVFKDSSSLYETSTPVIMFSNGHFYSDLDWKYVDLNPNKEKVFDMIYSSETNLDHHIGRLNLQKVDTLFCSLKYKVRKDEKKLRIIFTFDKNEKLLIHKVE